LGDIAGKEIISTDDEALAVLAEAGDGSMRDALSIMDQAIACCGTKLSGDLVRGLVGNVGSEVFEELMGTVARSSSEEALRLLDRVMIEGHNPAHFARQLVRFLRNTVVAKVAGDDSSLLQISSDERARVGRVAGQFSEEDLARFLQIMLRTFDELGYRQEQRFHLELGVLKLVHAQRILPLEQILSQAAGATEKVPEGSRSTALRPPAVVASSSVPAAMGGPSARPSAVSPFEADRARKGRNFDPEMSAAPPSAQAQPSATATAVAVEEPHRSEDPGTILGHVVVALEKMPGGDNLASTLAEGAAAIQGNELIITVARPQSVIPFIMNAEQRQIATAAAASAAGRTLKVTIVGGAKPDANGSAAVVRPRNGASARSRAAEDPIVQRMREKFGAEIRTVIDHREKN
jgi:DNA polymerase-3 subunit gamma/tau